MGKKIKEPGLNIVNGLYLCDSCLDGAGGECHTPGCAFWMCAGMEIVIRDNVLQCGGEIIPLQKERPRKKSKA